MAEKRVIELNIETNEKSLKAQLRAAQQDVAALSEKFGATSQAAIDAAKRAAQLKDAIGDAKNLTDAFNPDAKFNALTQSLSGVLNGFQAFEGALGLVGVESEAVQESLLKVQSAMALAQGVDGVLEAVDSFKTLGAQVMKFGIVQKIVTAGQWLWNTAVAANPIGALTVAITGLIAAGYALVKYFQTSTAENEKNAASIKNSTRELKKQNLELEKSQTRLEENNKFQLDYAKASGKSAQELRKLALANQEEELAMARKNKELAKSTYLREKDILASMKANDADEEVIKKQEELVKKYGEAAKQSREIAEQEYKDLVNLKRQQRIDIRQEQTDSLQEQEQANSEAYDKQQEALKSNLDALIELEIRKDDTNEKVLKNLLNKRLKLENLSGAELELARQNNADKVKEALKSDVNYTLGLETKKVTDLKIISDNRLQTLQGSLDAEVGIKLAAAEKEQLILETQAVKARKLEENSQSFKVKMVQQGLQTISSITELFGRKSEKAARRAFQINKAAQMASATIDTYKSATAAYASQFVPIPDPSSPVRGAIAAGVAIAAGLVNVAKIASQKFEGGGSGGGGGTAPAGGGGGAPQMQAPNFNVIGSSGVNQLAQIQQQPTRAYVVSGDVATGLSLERNRLQNASF
jgi:hypothetical protein